MTACLSVLILIIANDAAEAGPFRDFFRAVRSAVAQPHEKARPHRTAHRHHETPPTDDSTSQTASASSPAPPGETNVRFAKAAPSASQEKSDMPYGTPVPGKPGLVTSPFAPDKGYVDVTGFPPGTEVQDPYTGKIFLTP